MSEELKNAFITSALVAKGFDIDKESILKALAVLKQRKAELEKEKTA